MAVLQDAFQPVPQGESAVDPRRWKALFVLALVLLFTESKERTKALGIWSGLAGLGGTMGVLMSGIIVNFISWRWIFFVNIPIAVVAIVLIPGLVSESKAENTSRRIDVPGAVLV